MSVYLRLIALLLCLVLTAPARAQADPELLIREGVALRRTGRDAEALALFRQAFELKPTPRARAQIALAQHALANWVDAEQGLIDARAAVQDPWIQKHDAHLAQALQTVRAHLASIQIASNVAGAQLLVDGKLVGVAPLAQPLRVVAGTLRLTAQLEGYSGTEQVLQAPPGSELSVMVTLTPLPVNAVAEPSVAGTIASTAQASAPAPKLEPSWPSQPINTTLSTSQPESGDGMQTAAAVVLISGAVLLAGAITAHVVREYHVSKHNDEEFCTAEVDCTRYAEIARRATPWAIAGYSAAGLALATGLVLELAAPGGASSSASRVGAGPGVVYLEQRWSF